jgi:hypothetical protein
MNTGTNSLSDEVDILSRPVSERDHARSGDGDGDFADVRRL